MMVYLTRRYRFAASHRLDSASLTPEENAHLYGKCNNPYGHGHNYVLHVTMAGPVDPATGMVFNLAVLDRIVEEHVIEKFDHTHLNLDVDIFRQIVPTTENLCIEIYKLLRPKLEQASEGAARLHKVQLEETNANFFEYEGPSS